MAYVINENKAVALLDRYFNSLKEMGYVKPNSTSRFLLYLFLIDFTECVFSFMTESDYAKVRSLLARIFSGGDCLLPYPYDCDKNITLGMPFSMGRTLRRTRLNNEDSLRKTDEENLRRV